MLYLFSCGNIESTYAGTTMGDCMRVAMAQMNPTLGDFKRNRQKILNFTLEAKNKDAELVVFPEMSLFGYHPGDLLERESVVNLQLEALNALAQELPKDMGCLFGCVQKNEGRGKPYYNSAVFVSDGKVQNIFNKQLLPVYDVFDDSRHFHPGKVADNKFCWKTKNILVLLCEDMWGWDPIHPSNPIEALDGDSFDLVVNLSASPFTLKKKSQRKSFAQKTVRHLGAPLVYTNIVGAQDELIFDGQSFIMNTSGEVVHQSPSFDEDLSVVDTDSLGAVKKESPQNDTRLLRSALILGIRDYAQKIGFSKVHLGLSGGIDSAVVACLAAEALGPANVVCLSMPSQFNAAKSYSLAQDLAKNLGSPFFALPIQDGFESLIKSYESTFGDKEFGLIHENMQARLRGLLLMAFANDKGSLLLSTGNKSEYATGYTTLYGDMCGGLAVIGDLLKRQVFQVAESYAESIGGPLPRGIIDRPPSAELRPNQKDSDSLPDYNLLDTAVEKLVCEKREAQGATEKWVVERLMLSEFKRWQAPPILKVSAHAFGQGRRMPIAHKARV